VQDRRRGKEEMEDGNYVGVLDSVSGGARP